MIEQKQWACSKSPSPFRFIRQFVNEHLPMESRAYWRCRAHKRSQRCSEVVDHQLTESIRHAWPRLAAKCYPALHEVKDLRGGRIRWAGCIGVDLYTVSRRPVICIDV